MWVLLIVLALLASFVGFLFLSQATMGVGIICGACLLAILARIAQAESHHGEIRKMMGKGENQPA